MSQIKIYTNDSTSLPFREMSMKKFGYGRGSISQAADEALYRWANQLFNIYNKLENASEIAKNDSSVIAIILFGSFARRDKNWRDVDVGIILEDGSDSTAEYRKYSAIFGENDVFDFSVINDLPFHVQSSALNDAVLLYTKDKAELYNYSIRIIKAASDSKLTLKEVLGNL